MLAFRLKQKPARSAAALGTLAVVAFYLIAQMVGAGVLIEALVGIDFSLAVILTGAFMVIYIIAGGMLATSWVQIIKAFMLMSAAVGHDRLGHDEDELRTLWSCSRTRRGAVGGGPEVPRAGALPGHAARHGVARAGPGARHGGTAAHPHALLHRARRQGGARSSVMWAMALIGAFYLMTTFLGFGARALLGKAGEEAAGTGGNLAVPNLAEQLGGDVLPGDHRRRGVRDDPRRRGGLVLSASGAVAHDIWSNVVRDGPATPSSEESLGREDRGRGASARSRSPSPSSAARA